MTAKHLPAPCWYAKYPGGEDHDNLVHYLTAEDAGKVAADAMKDDPLVPVEVGRWPGPCLMAECDGDCGEQMEDEDEGWLLHFADWKELLASADAWGWTVDGDRIWCEDDKPDGVTGQAPYEAPANMDPLPGMEAIG